MDVETSGQRPGHQVCRHANATPPLSDALAGVISTRPATSLEGIRAACRRGGHLECHIDLGSLGRDSHEVLLKRTCAGCRTPLPARPEDRVRKPLLRREISFVLRTVRELREAEVERGAELPALSARNHLRRGRRRAKPVREARDVTSTPRTPVLTIAVIVLDFPRRMGLAVSRRDAGDVSEAIDVPESAALVAGAMAVEMMLTPGGSRPV